MSPMVQRELAPGSVDIKMDGDQARTCYCQPSWQLGIQAELLLNVQKIWPWGT